MQEQSPYLDPNAVLALGVSIECMLELNSDLNSPINTNGVCPLHFAAGTGDLRLCTLLLERGASLHVRDERRCTALHYAEKFPACLKLLILAGSDPQACDSKGRTALFYAALRGHYESVKYLLSLGADPCLGDIKSITPLKSCFYAFEQQRCYYSPMFQLLALYGSPSYPEMKIFNHELYTAYYNDSCIEHLENFKPQDEDDLTVLENLLSLAAVHNQIAVVQYIVEKFFEDEVVASGYGATCVGSSLSALPTMNCMLPFTHQEFYQNRTAVISQVFLRAVARGKCSTAHWLRKWLSFKMSFSAMQELLDEALYSATVNLHTEMMVCLLRDHAPTSQALRWLKGFINNEFLHDENKVFYVGLRQLYEWVNTARASYGLLYVDLLPADIQSTILRFVTGT